MSNAKNLLQAAKNQKENGGVQKPIQKRQARPMSESVIASSSDLESLENLYFNPQEQNINPLTESYEIYPNGEKREIYDPNKDLQEMTSFSVSNVNSKIPQAILESLMKNPLNLSADVIHVNEDVNGMMDELQNKATDIIDKLDARDKQSKNISTPNQHIFNESVENPLVGDYSQLAQLIESIIDKKFSQYSKGLLTENRGNDGKTISFIRLGDTFTFMDSENNVYECKMVFKGKGKIKKK